MKQAAVVGGYNCMLFTKKKLNTERKQKKAQPSDTQTDRQKEKDTTKFNQFINCMRETYHILWDFVNKLIKIKKKKTEITITKIQSLVKKSIYVLFVEVSFVHSRSNLKAMKTLLLSDPDDFEQQYLLMTTTTTTMMMAKIYNVLIKTKTIQTIWSSSRLQALFCDCECSESCHYFITNVELQLRQTHTPTNRPKKKIHLKWVNMNIAIICRQKWAQNESDCVIRRDDDSVSLFLDGKY